MSITSTTPIRRGDVVVIADRSGAYTGKPRPAVVVQSDAFPIANSVTVCPIGSHETELPWLRVAIAPSSRLALERRSFVQIDKITTIRRDRARAVLGQAAAADMARIGTALAIYLAIA